MLDLNCHSDSRHSGHEHYDLCQLKPSSLAAPIFAFIGKPEAAISAGDLEEAERLLGMLCSLTQCLRYAHYRLHFSRGMSKPKRFEAIEKRDLRHSPGAGAESRRDTGPHSRTRLPIPKDRKPKA
jgi:hypothetical protein